MNKMQVFFEKNLKSMNIHIVYTNNYSFLCELHKKGRRQMPASQSSFQL